MDYIETTVSEKSGHSEGLTKTARSPDVGCIKDVHRSEDVVSFLWLIVFQGHECNVKFIAVNTFTQLDQLTFRAGMRRDVVNDPGNPGWFG